MATISEAARQAAVLRLLWTPAGQAFSADDLRTAGLAPGCEPGLAAHRRHARASARRNLIAAYPTVGAMLGEEAMTALAIGLWLAQPPLRGDVGEWGEGLAEHIAAQTELLPWPWLPDVARLDWARHRCGRTASQPVDTDSLLALASVDPARLRLVLQPHVVTVRANWPLDGLWRAHQSGHADAQAQAVQAALAVHDGATEAVLCWWGVPDVSADVAAGAMRALTTEASAAVHGVQQCPLSNDDAAWMALLGTPGTSLQAALDQAPPGFDFSAWFTQALRQGWLQGAAPLPSPFSNPWA